MVHLVPTNLRAGTIRVLDFNPLFVKRPPLFPEDYHAVIQSSVTRKIVSEVGVIAKGDVWMEDILSGLPYYEVTTKESFPLTEVLMDDERIIGLKVSSYECLFSVLTSWPGRKPRKPKYSGIRCLCHMNVLFLWLYLVFYFVKYP